ncbi:multidrug-resistance type transporter aminotriazole resistance [Diaporthe australafricana]|uniref:Multidrug-resistance type transporter aminotriazole resistance n=1 Tax=Diaporthe australafricana TaxID=127596 RepID=A0ABR3W600_9PEZI
MNGSSAKEEVNHRQDTATDAATRQYSGMHQGADGMEALKEDIPSPRLSDSDDRDEPVENQALAKTKTVQSIAETLPWYRELLFVSLVCLAQLYTQAGVGQVLSIVHIIADDFGISESQLPWFLAGYSLTVGTFILFSGRLGDMFGYKTLYIVGMAWFSVWSLVCGLSVYSGHVLFVFGRVLQGIGPALVLPNGLALLGAAYEPGLKKSLAFAAFAATAPAGSVIAAAFAGLFTLAWWPWTFWCFSLVLAGTTVLAYFVIPPVPSSHKENRPDTWRGKLLHLDLPGAVTGIAGLVLFNFAWNQAPLVGWDMPYVGVTLALGLIFVGAFFWIEIKYSPEPLVPFHALSSDVSFVLGAVACGWGCFGIWIWYTWEFLLQLRGRTPLGATANFVPVVVSGAIAAAVVGVLLHRVGPPIIMTAALIAFTVGTILMATCPIEQTYWAQSFVSFIITPWGMDMSFPAATIILSNAVSREHQGIAASLVNTVVNYSIALGLGIAGTIELSLNNGGTTQADKLKGYRAAYYFAIALAALGVVVCIGFLIKSRKGQKRPRDDEKSPA